jgi:hypothetical protein
MFGSGVGVDWFLQLRVGYWFAIHSLGWGELLMLSFVGHIG